MSFPSSPRPLAKQTSDNPMPMNSVSVIIPTYNRAHLVGEAIESVLNQDIEDCSLEIIVVDDGSVDDTRTVVAQFGQDVRYVYQENQGVGAARNRGLEEASGEWLAFLDSDDLWLPDKLSLQFQVLNAFSEYKVVHSTFYTSDGKDIIITKGLEYWVAATEGGSIDDVDWHTFYPHTYNSKDYGITRVGLPFTIYAGNLFRPLLYSVCATCWTSLIHRDCLQGGVRFAHVKMSEDYYFYCRLSEMHDVLFMDTPTVENRAHSGPRETQNKASISLATKRSLYKEVFLPSVSPRKPSATTIRKQIQKNNTQLLFEYLKEGELQPAKTLVAEEQQDDGFEKGWKLFLLLLLTALPFNTLSWLRTVKQAVEASMPTGWSKPQ